MQNLIDFITGGVTEFTPQTIVGIIVFVLIFDGIMGVVSECVGISKGGRR